MKLQKSQLNCSRSPRERGLIHCLKVLKYAAMLLYSLSVSAQGFEVQLNPSLYAGGYNISCHGSSNGAINTYIMGGSAPFTFIWNTGATSKNLSNLSAGHYTVTVTASNGNTATAQINLIQPEAFTVNLVTEEKAPGYHISEYGGNDGVIESNVSGGVPPYTYLWNSGQIENNVTGLSAGNYTLTLHDATNCVANGSITLIEPTLLHIVSISSPKVVGNYNISCIQTGSIQLQVAGGAPPYSFEWQQGFNTQNLTNLTEAREYNVLIRDEAGAEVNGTIMLTAAPEVVAQISPYIYPNGNNTSCFNCNNGSIVTSISSGTAPYIFAWNNGAFTQNASNLAAGVYSVVITDAAGCTSEKTALLTAPEREDWTMNGNSGVSPLQYIGTSDNKDLLFKRNAIETMRFDTSGTRFEKLITTKNGIALNAAQTEKIQYDGSTANRPYVFFGATSSKLNTCIQPNYAGVNTDYSFDGFLLSKPANPATNVDAALVLGSAPWDGNGIIEVEGVNNNAQAQNGLLINYFCGRDVAICTNDAVGGIVRTGKHFEVGGPWPSSSSIAANIRGTSQTGLRVETITASNSGALVPNYTAQLVAASTNTKLIGGFVSNPLGWEQEVFSIKADGETSFGLSTAPAFYIKPLINTSNFNYTADAFVGIGTNSPQARLHVEGDAIISGLGNSSNTNYLLQANNLGLISKVQMGDLPSILPQINYWSSENNGIDVFHMEGNVGIKTNAPVRELTVNGNVQFLEDGANPNNAFQILKTGEVPKRRGISIDDDPNGHFNFYIHDWQSGNGGAAFNFINGAASSNLGNLMTIYADGKVQIGIKRPTGNHTDAKLSVEGKIVAQSLFITKPETWADEVFDSNYKLLPLSELEKYYKTHHHLPDVLPEPELLENGYEVNDMIKLLLKKIEELTLYNVDLQKQINEFKP